MCTGIKDPGIDSDRLCPSSAGVEASDDTTSPPIPLKTYIVIKLSLFSIMHHTTRHVGEWRLIHVFLTSAVRGEEQRVVEPPAKERAERSGLDSRYLCSPQ